MRSLLVPICLLVAMIVVLTDGRVALGQGGQRPRGTKATAELFEDSALTKSKNTTIKKKESAALEVLSESGSAVEVRCGDKRGWVSRSDLEYSLPPNEQCHEGPGSVRGSNGCR